MTWNYRVIKYDYHPSPYYGVHEVYYEDEKPMSVTEHAVGLFGDEAKDIQDDLELIMDAFSKPVLNWTDIVKDDA